MKNVSGLIKAMPPSGIRQVMELASKMQGVIHLEVGEPSFKTPDHVIDAAFAAARDGHTGYTATLGIPSLRRVIAERYSAKWGKIVQPEQVMVTSGAVNAVGAVLLGLVDEGDEVLVPDPSWPNYVGMVMLTHGRAVPYALRPEYGYIPDVAELATLITDRTKVLMLNTPASPTGAVFPRATMEALIKLATEHDLYVVSDEIYEELAFDREHTPAALYDDANRVITISGCSKMYAMTGWRLGYAIADPSLLALISKLQEVLISCPSIISQYAAEAALNGPQDCVEEMRSAYHRRRDLVRGILESSGLLPVVPRGAFYALLDLRSLGMSGRQLALALLEEERVATAPGDTFGTVSDGMVRISLAASDDDLAEGCRRIKAFAARHKGSV